MQILYRVSVDRLIRSPVHPAIRLIISVEIYATSHDSLNYGEFPDSAFGRPAVVHELARPADID
jgi:hypothetical protein